MATRTSLCLYQQPVTLIFTRLTEWFGTVKLQSNPFIKNYCFIIVSFSSPHFSIYDIFHTKENTQKFQRKSHSLWKMFYKTTDQKSFIYLENYWKCYMYQITEWDDHSATFIYIQENTTQPGIWHPFKKCWWDIACSHVTVLFKVWTVVLSTCEWCLKSFFPYCIF